MNYVIKLIKKTYHMIGPKESKIVLGNVLSLSTLQVIVHLFPIVILPYLFRVLGPDKFGLIAFAQAFVQYFIILTDYGFNASATKEVSLCHEDKDQINKIFSAVMIIKIMFGILSWGILMSILHFVPKFQQNEFIYIISFGTVVGSILFPLWVFQGTEKMQYIAKLNMVGEFAYGVCIFLLIKTPEDFIKVPLITSSIAMVTGLVGQYILFNRLGVFFHIPPYKDIVHQLKSGWHIFISYVAINAYTTTRVFAVGLLTNNSLTGFYSIAEKISGTVQTFPLSSFTQAVFPRLSKIYHKSQEKAFEIMTQIQKITVIVSLICLPLILLIAPFLIRVVCGKNYPEAVASLQFLLISVFFISSNAFRVQYLLVCGKTDAYSKIHICMALIGLPLIITMIYLYSYVGAAIATIAIEAGVFTITYFTIRRMIKNV